MIRLEHANIPFQKTIRHEKAFFAHVAPYARKAPTHSKPSKRIGRPLTKIPTAHEIYQNKSIWLHDFLPAQHFNHWLMNIERYGMFFPLLLPLQVLFSNRSLYLPYEQGRIKPYARSVRLLWIRLWSIVKRPRGTHSNQFRVVCWKVFPSSQTHSLSGGLPFALYCRCKPNCWGF